MSLDGGWALILATILGVVLTGVGALIWRHVDAAQKDADEAIEKVEALRNEFMAYKSHVSDNYAKAPHLDHMETKILSVIQRLEAKVDRLVERP